MKVEDIKLAILQPEVPHYRASFFRELSNRVKNITVYVYNSLDNSKKQGFSVEQEGYIKYIANKQYKGVLFYNPKLLLQKDVDVLVLMWHFAHVSTWLLLLTKWIHRKKIIIWGQGISVKRYLEEEKRPNILMKWMLALADGAWIYMGKEADFWKCIFPKKKIVALNNTLSGVEEMVEYNTPCSKDELKSKYNIKEKIILLFCARFNNPYRRVDLLLKTIEQLDDTIFGFVVIGEGCYKPDFSKFKNVYEFGAVYDENIKRDLFALSDVYFQPAWVGLSIVEAMAYGKPICTFKRQEDLLQCVEYSYIEDGENGLIFKDIDDCTYKIANLKMDDVKHMGECARTMVKEMAVMCKMVENAISIL
jgi:glycosyltransferase involved in cell wall biosynthesis